MTLLNARGLSTPEKRSWLLADLKRSGPHFAFLQETYFRRDSVPKLYNRDFLWVYHAPSPTPKSKRHSVVTLINIYLPNLDYLSFLQQLTPVVMGFREGFLLMGGDFNYAPEPLLDTARGTSRVSYAYLRKLKKELSMLDLVDPWRVMHPGERDYSYYSATHNTYTRIDFFLIPHKDLSMVTSSQLGSFSFSDHAPKHITMNWDARQTRPPTWRLNESVLQIPEVQAELDGALSAYFVDNTDPLIGTFHCLGGS